MGKRSFIKIVFSLVTVLLSGMLSWAVARFAAFSGDKAPSKVIPKSAIDQLQSGAPFYYVQAGVWLVREDEKSDVAVYDDKCPHLGCRYNWNSEKKVFECPCHNSAFDIKGQVKKGPANRPITSFRLSLDEKNVYKILPAAK